MKLVPLLLLVSSPALAQPWSVPPPAPTPASAPAPAPEPEPEPAPEPAPPPSFDTPAAMILFHGLCPSAARGPGCSGGLWVGMRTTMLLGTRASTIAFTADFKAGFGFGFGVEGDREENDEPESGSMAHAMADAEGAIGPGLRLGPLDVLSGLGIGGEALAWAHNKIPNDSFAESYWYGLVGLRLRLSESFAMFAIGSQRFSHWFLVDEVYQRRIEAGVAFLAESEDGKKADDAIMGVSAFYADYDGLVVAGVAITVGGSDLALKQN